MFIKENLISKADTPRTAINQPFFSRQLHMKPTRETPARSHQKPFIDRLNVL